MINAFDILKLYNSMISIMLITRMNLFGPNPPNPSMGRKYVQYSIINAVANSVSSLLFLNISSIMSFYFLPMMYGNFLLTISIMPTCNITATRKYIIVTSP